MSAKGAPKKRRRWIWWVVLAVAIVAVAAIAYPMLTSQQGTDVNSLSTAQVVKSDLRVTVSGSGNAVVGSAVSVDPGISGTVDDLSIKLGQTVKAGTLLFRVVNDDLDAAVVRAESSYYQSKQQVAQANQSVTQASNNLYNLQHPSAPATGPVKTASAADIKLAKLQVTSAKAGLTTANKGLDSAELALSQARKNADKRTVTAPSGGMVTVLNAQNGQALGSSSGSSSSGTAASTSSSKSAVEISDMSTLRAQVQINEVDLVNVKVGQKANVMFDALPSASVSGTVSAMSPTGTSSGGVVTYNVDITLATIDARLRPGMTCSADIETALKPGALTVPSSAVKSSNGKQYVEVIDVGATAARKVDVTTGATVGTTVEILSGVKAGEYVVLGSTTGSSSTAGGGSRGGFGAMMGGGR
ncbi:MAG: efflux RND transporter periplasmic adaptor subunit [Coriobacteriia bacterium]|nr:efflux RND transporter periplasmic adaptor subunit [Coriobacteriia bacterium]